MAGGKIILFLTCLLAIAELKKKYPRIQDVVTFSEKGNLNFISRLVKDIKAFVDIDKFHTDKELFRRQIRGNLEDTVLLEGKPINSRRVQTFYENQVTEYENATYLQLCTKVADCMLQLVYMARHNVKMFDSNTFLDKSSDTYRIMVLIRKLAYLYKKSTRILEILNLKQKNDVWVNDNTSAPAITLHHKVAKIHVDFLYYYEVLKRLYAAVKAKQYMPREKPPPKGKPEVW